MSANQPNPFHHLNQRFDRIYVLSLKRATDRHGRLEKLLAGMNWQFFWGTDKLRLNAENLEQSGLYDDQLHRQVKRTQRGMRIGEIACALSHRAIYQDVLDKGYPNALILEDDVMANPNFDTHFETAFANLPDDWELLMLGYYSEKYQRTFALLQRQVYLLYHHLKLANWHKVDQSYIRQMLMKRHNQHWYRIGKLVGGHSYAVSKSACEKFVRLQTPVIMQADRVFSYMSLLHGLKGYAIKEKLFGLSEMAKTSYIEYPNLIQKRGATITEN